MRNIIRYNIYIFRVNINRTLSFYTDNNIYHSPVPGLGMMWITKLRHKQQMILIPPSILSLNLPRLFLLPSAASVPSLLGATDVHSQSAASLPSLQGATDVTLIAAASLTTIAFVRSLNQLVLLISCENQFE